ncbi:hypothetical protein U9M48_022100 [Paspalum notatum var. saurae]|uniref:F-box domain-containing protein n=1 Tax=Paspalum notatum var. saurae TaxID=547442 RepID=A0AAQ3WTP3_PASNO
MADGAGAGAGPRPRAQARGRRISQTASLPLDIVLDIAARTDPATLVRCAATCRDLRARVADPGFLRGLRLRHADCFVPPLLRGHLIQEPYHRFYFDKDLEDAEAKRDSNMYLLDAAAGRLRRASKAFPAGPDGEPLRLHRPVSAREGLLLVHKPHELRVFNLATGRSQALPPGGPEFPVHYVLLVGDGAAADGSAVVGRPFQVVKASLVFEYHHRHLKVQTFSSELGAWGPCTEIRTPQIQGAAYEPLRPMPLVVAGAMHWLCLTDSAGYVLKLRVRAAAPPRLAVTNLPENFPYNIRRRWYVQHLMATMAAGAREPRRASHGRREDISVDAVQAHGEVEPAAAVQEDRQGVNGFQDQHLMATMAAGGSPAVLVTDGEKISAWTQSKHTGRWSQQPQVVIDYAAISTCLRSMRMPGGNLPLPPMTEAKLLWFAERSGIVLIDMDDCFLWLDLQSRKIVRGTSDSRITYKTVYCPYEMDLSTWVPTFSRSL